jgi:hypothetical protein
MSARSESRRCVTAVTRSRASNLLPCLLPVVNSPSPFATLSLSSTTTSEHAPTPNQDDAAPPKWSWTDMTPDPFPSTTAPAHSQMSPFTGGDHEPHTALLKVCHAVQTVNVELGLYFPSPISHGSERMKHMNYLCASLPLQGY